MRSWPAASSLWAVLAAGLADGALAAYLFRAEGGAEPADRSAATAREVEESRRLVRSQPGGPDERGSSLLAVRAAGAGEDVAEAQGGSSAALTLSDRFVLGVRQGLRDAQSAAAALGGTGFVTSTVGGSGSLFQDADGATPGSGVFCYAFISEPPEPTAPYLARQLRDACDDWQFFSTFKDEEQNVIALYSASDAKSLDWKRMPEAAIAAAWHFLAEQGHLRKFRWIVKVDSDTYVRSSTLRPALSRYSPTVHSILSVGGLQASAEPLQGFFATVPAALASELAAVGTDAGRGCSGAAGSSGSGCVGKVQGDSLVDTEGRPLVASEVNGLPAQARASADARDEPVVCEDIGDLLLEHGRQEDSGQAFCSCSFRSRNGTAACLSPKFAIVHPVRTVELYRQLSRVFP
eukprot:TRINITY_DN57311_c0_g1_i1.p1 TRINITY_DN57311_c0_g1~~TRINITY_DN57311_c0_g1_i1.p1  ORF type:complete len:406 (-),score=87.41 TRINITY_DN57311_c0_g1_i1:37-1254(-)